MASNSHLAQGGKNEDPECPWVCPRCQSVCGSVCSSSVFLHLSAVPMWPCVCLLCQCVHASVRGASVRASVLGARVSVGLSTVPVCPCICLRCYCVHASVRGAQCVRASIHGARVSLCLYAEPKCAPVRGLSAVPACPCSCSQRRGLTPAADRGLPCSENHACGRTLENDTANRNSFCVVGSGDSGFPPSDPVKAVSCGRGEAWGAGTPSETPSLPDPLQEGNPRIAAALHAALLASTNRGARHCAPPPTRPGTLRKQPVCKLLSFAGTGGRSGASWGSKTNRVGEQNPANRVQRWSIDLGESP